MTFPVGTPVAPPCFTHWLTPRTTNPLDASHRVKELERHWEYRVLQSLSASLLNAGEVAHPISATNALAPDLATVSRFSSQVIFGSGPVQALPPTP